MHAFPDPYNSRHVDIRLREDAGDVPAEVLAAYGLEKAAVARLETGSYNVHFEVESKIGKFDLRHSNRPIDASNLKFEAELLLHLRNREFKLAPELKLTESGETNFWRGNDGWTLFRWIEHANLDPRPVMNASRIDSAATTLAEFHEATADFKPTAKRGDWPIFSKPEEWNRRWANRAEELSEHLGEDGDDLHNLSEQCSTDLDDVDFDRLSVTCCHGDYRPRNLRFREDSVVSVFDLDTAMTSTRLLDVGGAVTRFSPLSGHSSTPQADIEAGARFLRAYHAVSPLTSYEWQVLPIFIRWRLIRDTAIYFDRWWTHVRPAAMALFDGVAEEMVSAVNS